MDRILDDIRDGVLEEVSREHLVSRQDILNIRRRLNIDCVEKDANDFVSVNAWVKEMQVMQYNPVLLFKHQGMHCL